MLDAIGAIPQPPTHLEMPQTAELIFNIGIGIPVAIGVVIAIRHLMTGRGPLLLCCLVGGLCAASLEPVVDVLGLVYLKEEGAVGTFTILDRTMPLYIPFVYTWYVGGLGYVAYRVFEYGVTTKTIFLIWAGDFLVDVVLESPGILAGTYLYYGQQPFDIWGFPLWWGFVNPVMPLLAGALIYKLKPHLSGWKLVGIVPLIPMADGIANGATAWPMWAALNQTDVSYVWTYAASLVTLGLALFCVWIIALVVAKPAEATADPSAADEPAEPPRARARPEEGSRVPARA